MRCSLQIVTGVYFVLLGLTACGGGDGESSPIADKASPTVLASNAGGSYDNYLKVSLSCDDGNGSGCENIYYTLDGSTVSTTSSVYTAPFEITSDTSVSFMARDLKGNTSVAYTEVYIINDTLAPEVTADPASGYANNVTEINLNCAEDCKAIYYTLDGSPATQSSILYSTPITITQDTTLHFIAVDVAGNISDVNTMAYIYDITKPIAAISTLGGLFAMPQQISLSCTDANGSGCANIYYTIDGTEPTLASAKFSEDIRITSESIVKAFAIDQAGNISETVSESYVIDVEPPTVSVKVAAAIYATGQNVELLCEDGTGIGCAAMYYTVDSSNPTTFSSAYSTPIPINTTTTLTVIAVDDFGNQSLSTVFEYVIDQSPPAVTVSIPGGVFNSSQSLVLSCDDGDGIGCANIWYTLDGSTPTQNSATYSTAIVVSTESTLNFFASDDFGTASQVLSEFYAFDFVPPVVMSSYPASGGTTSGINPEIRVSFDSDMATDSKFVVTEAGREVAGRFQVQNRSVIFRASENLQFSTTYLVNLGTGVMDVAGNRADASYSFSFTSLAAPTVISTKTRADIVDRTIVENSVGNRMEYWAESTGNSAIMMYRYYTAASSTWTEPAPLPDAGNSRLRIVAGNLNFLATFSSMFDVPTIRLFDGMVWGESIEVSPRVRSTSITAASNGNNYLVAWRVKIDGAEYINAVTFDGSNLSTVYQLNSPGGRLLHNSLLSDGTGYGMFWSQQNASGKLEIRASVFDGTTWSSPVNVDAATGSVSAYTFTAGNNSYLVAWNQIDSGIERLYARVFINNAWQPAKILDASGNSTHTIIKTDVGYGALFNDAGSTVIRSYLDTSWSAPIVLATGSASNFSFASDGSTYAVSESRQVGGTVDLRNQIVAKFYTIANSQLIAELPISDPANANNASKLDVVSDGNSYLFLWAQTDLVDSVESIYGRVYKNNSLQAIQLLENNNLTMSPKIDLNWSALSTGYHFTWKQKENTDLVIKANEYKNSAWTGIVSYLATKAHGAAQARELVENDVGHMLAYWSQFDAGRWLQMTSIYNGTNWNEPQIMADCSFKWQAKQGKRIVTNGTDFVFVCINKSSVLVAYRYQQTAWQAPIVLSSGYPYLNNSVASDGTGYVVTWKTLESLESQPIYVNTFSAGAWSGETIITNTAGVAALPSITGNASGYGITWINGLGVAKNAFISVNVGNGWSTAEQLNILPLINGAHPIIVATGATFTVAWAKSDIIDSIVTTTGTVGNWSTETFLQTKLIPLNPIKLASNGSSVELIWNNFSAVYAATKIGAGWSESSNIDFITKMARGLDVATNGNAYAATWSRPASIFESTNSAIATIKRDQAWLAIPLLLENQRANCSDVQLSSSNSGFRSMWSQANAADNFDTSTDRIWVSGEF